MTQSLGFWGERIDLYVSQGRSFGPHRLYLRDEAGNPWPLTGATLQGQVRKTADAASVAAALVFTVIDSAAGVVDLDITDEAAAALLAAESPDVAESRYVWDAQITTAADGRVIPAIWGDVYVLRRVTRP